MNGEYEHYFDGISSEKQAHFDSLTLEELEAEIEAERKKCETMEEW
ncbi:hypothetical protein [uncultured Ruminococcus sp.]|nr:hypothetical protein [uncultured Ruminococcus sp.]MBQ1432415.1 hypothetical protein [Ruminococcus sp.]